MFPKVLVCALLVPAATAQQTISLRAEDGGTVAADLYGSGERGVVLVHGGQFDKESWAPQAKILSEAGFRVVSIDLRGYGNSHGPGEADLYTAPLYLDVLAAVHHLRSAGAKDISLLGASIGGDAAGKAVASAKPGEINRLILLAAVPDAPPEKLVCPKLVIAARDDESSSGPRLPSTRAYYEKMPEPKKFVLLEGRAHAQFLFQTDQAGRVMSEILRFLRTPE
jgi:pimeloyl-ACP methyl ester carboxylesterase